MDLLKKIYEGKIVRYFVNGKTPFKNIIDLLKNI